jgi:hypothetical protein
MKLGNSNGNNRGKKYLMRNKEMPNEILPENKTKFDQFAQWFESMNDTLVNFLKYKECFDEDVYYYTFLRMSEKILYTGLELKDKKAYFHRAYYTNYIQRREQGNRFCSLGAYDQIDTRPNNAVERERKQTILEEDIFTYIYNEYDLREFELFKMYINLKPAINYQILSEITTLPVHVIQRIISKILKDIRSNRKFVLRYREIA